MSSETKKSSDVSSGAPGCSCYGCKPHSVPDDYNETTCSVCFVPVGGVYPNVPAVGSICVDCAAKINKQHKEDPNKRDPYTRKWMVTCTDAGCGDIVHSHNMMYHFIEKQSPSAPGRPRTVDFMALVKAMTDRKKEIDAKNDAEANAAKSDKK